ncbi:MAG: hypothetical protein ACOCT9_00090 [archaeon]
MEANGFKRRINDALNNKEFIKLIFQYPSSDRAVVKRGYVKGAFDDSFDFQEIKDGLVTYSYRYLVEIKEEVRG